MAYTIGGGNVRGVERYEDSGYEGGLSYGWNGFFGSVSDCGSGSDIEYVV